MKVEEATKKLGIHVVVLRKAMQQKNQYRVCNKK